MQIRSENGANTFENYFYIIMLQFTSISMKKIPHGVVLMFKTCDKHEKCLFDLFALKNALNDLCGLKKFFWSILAPDG